MPIHKESGPAGATASQHVPTTLVRRRASDRSWIRESLARRETFIMAAFGTGGLMLAAPVAFLALLPTGMALVASRLRLKFRLPFRAPFSWAGPDYGSPLPQGGHDWGRGILYLGHEKQTGEGLWTTAEDACRHAVALGTTGSGKALPLDTPVLTPSGWVRNGDLRPGDLIAHPFGGVSTVTGVYPQGELEILRVRFEDGRSADCSIDHLWAVFVSPRNPDSKEIPEMRATPNPERPRIPGGGAPETRLMTAGDIAELLAACGGRLDIRILLAAPAPGARPFPESREAEAVEAAWPDPGENSAFAPSMALAETPERRRDFLRKWIRESGFGVELGRGGVRISGLSPRDGKALQRIVWSLGGIALLVQGEGMEVCAHVEIENAGELFPGIRKLGLSQAGPIGLRIVSVEKAVGQCGGPRSGKSDEWASASESRECASPARETSEPNKATARAKARSSAARGESRKADEWASAIESRECASPARENSEPNRATARAKARSSAARGESRKADEWASASESGEDASPARENSQPSEATAKTQARDSAARDKSRKAGEWTSPSQNGKGASPALENREPNKATVKAKAKDSTARVKSRKADEWISAGENGGGANPASESGEGESPASESDRPSKTGAAAARREDQETSAKHSGKGKPTATKTKMSCIKTSRKDGLYVIKDWIVTHNTEMLLGIAGQAMCWGSGFLLIDGKGTAELYARVWAMAKRAGREQDVMVINFMDSPKGPDGRARESERQTHTANPFAKGTPSQLANLIVTLMGAADGKNDIWKSRAVALASALTRALCDLRDAGALSLDVQAARDFLAFGDGFDKQLLMGKRIQDIREVPKEAWEELRGRPGMTQLYLRALGGEMSTGALRALRGFFDTLPGFSLAKALNGQPQEEKTTVQYGFLSMQMTRLFGSLADDYGHIFNTPCGEVDFSDIVMGRRILVVLLPALQKSEEEMANCGRIIIAMLKIIMSEVIPSRLEAAAGESAAVAQPLLEAPFMAVLDEAGYYMTEGVDVIMAQARALGIMVMISSQDMASMQKRAPKIAESAMANANLFAIGKTVDAGKTLEYIQRVTGQARVAESPGLKPAHGLLGRKWTLAEEASFRSVDRISLGELQGMAQGEFFTLFEGSLALSKTFYTGRGADGGVLVNRLERLDGLDLLLYDNPAGAG